LTSFQHPVFNVENKIHTEIFICGLLTDDPLILYKIAEAYSSIEKNKN